MPTQLFKLSELADVRSGYTFRGALEHDPSGDVRVLQIKDLRQNAAIEPDTLIAITWDGKASLMDMQIPLPPLATQQKLIALQAVWDEEDELIERLQTNREQMLQGIYQHLIKA